MRWFSAVVLVVAIRTGAVAAVPSDTLMSSDTRGFASIVDLQSLTDHWDQTQLGQLCHDEAMKPFVEDMRRQIERKLSGARQKLGLKPDDLKSIAGGEIGLALVERQGARAAVAVTVNITGRAGAAKALLTKIDQDLTKRNAKRSTAKSGAVDLTLYQIPPQDNDDVAHEAAFFVYKDMLCATDSRVEAEEMARRFGGQPGNRLADVKAYQETMRQCAAEAGKLAPEVRWFIDPFGYARASQSLMKDKAKKGKDYVNIFANQGFDAIQGMGGYVNLSVYGSFEMLHRTAIYAPPIPGEKDKYKLGMRVMKFPNGEDLTPEKWVPRQLAAYRTFHCDLQNAYSHFSTLFDAVAGYDNAFRDMIEGLETDPYGPQVKIEQELIRFLGDRVTLVTDYDVPITTKSERFLFAIEVKDELAVATAIDKIEKADENAHQRDFQGMKVWEITPPTEDVPELEIALDANKPAANAEGGKKNTAMSTSAVCVANGHLFVASHIDFLEHILGSGAVEPLADAGDFHEVDMALSQLMPGAVAYRGFLRTDEAYRPTYELLRQGKMPEAETLLGRLLNRLLTSPEDEDEGIPRKQKIDGRQLPNFEMVRRYFSPSGTLVRSTDTGWFVAGATLTKQAPQARAGGNAASSEVSAIR